MEGISPIHYLDALQQQRVRRELLSLHVLNGATAAFGLLLVTACIYFLLGRGAAIGSSVGVVMALIPDSARPRRGKFAHLLVAPLVGVPLFLAIQFLRPHPVEFGFFLVGATFIAFLATAWGVRGLGVTIGIMFGLLLALAPPPARDTLEAFTRTGWCALGSLLYVLYATAAGMALDGRHRTLALAELLMSIATLQRAHAAWMRTGGLPNPRELERQAALANQMQLARDLILERPGTPRRQLLVGMLNAALESRDLLIAGTLELDQRDVMKAALPPRFGDILDTLADTVEAVADHLLWKGALPAPPDHGAELAAFRAGTRPLASNAEVSPSDQARIALLDSISMRLADQDAAVRKLVNIANETQAPDLAAALTGWKLFVSPAYWSPHPLLRLWHWRDPALRHALRAALAMGIGYVVGHLLPWVSRDFWLLITIMVMLNGTLSQTVDRVGSCVAGTLIGCLIALLLLVLDAPIAVLLGAVVLSQGMAQAFVVRRYMVTAAGGTILGLLLVHLLNGSNTPGTDSLEYLANTLIGIVIAWAFSYVLPSWERYQIARTVQRLCVALARHARRSLAVASVDHFSGQPELAWRLARREAYDALGALVQATDRIRTEPRAVQPPHAPLLRLQANSYQLLGQLSAAQTLLLLRCSPHELDTLRPMIASAVRDIESALDLRQPDAPRTWEVPAHTEDGTPLRAIPEDLPDPAERDSSRWMVRRLARAILHADRIRADALLLRASLRKRPDAPAETPEAA